MHFFNKLNVLTYFCMDYHAKFKRKGRQEFLFQTQIQINKWIDQLIKLKMTMKPINTH